MKKFSKKSLIILALLTIMLGCTKNFEDINKDPNNPESVATGFIFTYVEKNVMDNLRDEWAGGRMFFLLPQYWSQINYTDEDRYAFRTTVTDAFWRAMYTSAMNLQNVINLNTNEETKTDALASGANENQIAAATILQMYIFSVLTDAFGDIPYSEAFQANQNRTPKYDPQSEIYPDMITKLINAVNMINLEADGIRFGDIIYDGDMAKWKKFGASLALRIAQRMEKRDNGAALDNVVNTFGADGFFTSNDENAKFAYVGAGDNGPLYDAWFTEARNDFTLSKAFVLLLKGENDDLNGKTNPFAGIADPRLAIYAPGYADV
ncbi:MAG: SusD/RagB family nutrient-binding outer membrane lipoprotein, partial [Sphingobacteriia bacterium]|nr:SusD/RagB family nutrient-binding outer membrane lipoprotein [Sphingobacteriia bacterium]